jgi:hypothetical protein
LLADKLNSSRPSDDGPSGYGALIAPLALLGLMLLRAEAAAQIASGRGAPEVAAPASVPLQVQFDLDAGPAYNDNLFWRPVGTADSILRITPDVDVRRDTARWAMDARYRFDSERYTNHPELNTPLARQDADLSLTMRPDTRTALALTGQYRRTLWPNELNVTTGLAFGRQPASVIDAGSEWTRRIGQHSSVLAGYAFTADHLQDGPDTRVHAAHARLSHEAGVQNNVYLTYIEERWAFQPGEPVSTHAVLAGWSKRLTAAVMLTLEGGPRLTDGVLAPELSAAFTRRLAQRATASLSYSRTQTVAVGVAGPIETDRALVAFAYRNPVSWDVALSGGAYRNVAHQTDIFAYQMSAEIKRALTPRVSLVTSLGAAFNDRKASDIAPVGEQVRQRVIALSLHLSPVRARRPRSEE